MKILQEVTNEKNGSLPLIERLYQDIVKDILTGKLPSGTKLTEANLCSQYKISRTPIREVLRQLETNGLIKYIPNRGAFVKGFSKNEVRDILWLRKDCEIKAVSWAITRITEEEEEEMSEIFSHMEFYTKKNDIAKMIDINTAFHRVIYKSTHNDLLCNLLINYQRYIHYASPTNYFVNRYLETVLDEHRLIYEAFLNRNVEMGEKAMEIHMNNSLRRRM